MDFNLNSSLKLMTTQVLKINIHAELYSITQNKAALNITSLPLSVLGRLAGVNTHFDLHQLVETITPCDDLNIYLIMCG